MHAVDPGLEVVPGAQAKHADTPEDAEYVPASQAKQSIAADAAEYCPAAQAVQLASLPTRDKSYHPG